MGYKNDYVLLKLCIANLKSRHNFKGLYHFTDFSNLEQIFKTGFLYSRNECIRDNIEFKDGANHDVLDRASNDIHDKVRFYYRPKTPTLYDNEGVKLKEYCNNIHIPMPVYLLFDEELILLDSTEFSDGNATSSNIGNTSSFFSNIDWDSVFHDTWFEPEYRNYIINKRQAELLSNVPVSINKYLKKIIFRCEADRKRAINVYGHDNRYEVDAKIFSDKNFNPVKKKEQENNFIKDYNVDYSFDVNGKKVQIIFDILFQKKWGNFKTTFNIIDVDGISRNDSIEYFDSKYNNTIKKDVEFIDWQGNILKNSIDNNEIKRLIITGPIEKFSKIEIYINDCLYIEEKLIKNEIDNYFMEIKKEGDKSIYIVNYTFKDTNIMKFKRKYEIINHNGYLVESGEFQIHDDDTNLRRCIKLDDYNSSWSKFKYYIDDVMYICESIKSTKIVSN